MTSEAELEKTATGMFSAAISAFDSKVQLRLQAEEIATLKADIALLKETLAHGLACMKTAREVHKADVAVIRAGYDSDIEIIRAGFRTDIDGIRAVHKRQVAALKNDCSKYCQPNGNRPRVETFSAGGGPLVFPL